ncbi:MAG: glycosyltransferase family 2 protein [bacterium]|nr:glycosyltransferase family 2 protein [bacterium]
MNITIIIAAFNSEEHIAVCIESLYKSTFKNFETIIVDNGSTDKTITIVKKLQKQYPITIIQNDSNFGASVARNSGARKANGKLLFFLDHDAMIARDCLSEISQFFLLKDAGAAQCKLIDPSGEIDSLGHFITYVGFPYEINEEIMVDDQKPHKILGAKTAGLVIRSSVFQKIGGFDEDYLISAEDTDISWRIWLAKSSLYYLPSAHVIHYASNQKPQTDAYRKRILYEGSKNLINMIFKNADRYRLSFLLPFTLLVWIILSFKFLFMRDVPSALAIYKGIWWNVTHIYETWDKRMKNYYDGNMVVLDHTTLFGTISSIELIKKGWRWGVHA